MKITPHKFLAVILAVALLVTCWPRPRDTTGVAGRQAVPDARQLRWVAKELIAREVADGRRSLVEAAALYGALNRLPPATRELNWEDEDDSRLHAPAQTNEERLCRQVIRWVQRLLHDTPERARQTVARLEVEFVEAQARLGGLRLPDPARVEPIEELLGRVRSAAAQPPYRDPLRPPHQVEDASGAKD
jgi:hypothetical protein